MADTDNQETNSQSGYADVIDGYKNHTNPLSKRNPVAIALEGFALQFDNLNKEDFPDGGARRAFWEELYGFDSPPPAPEHPGLLDNTAPVSRFQRGRSSALDSIYGEAEARISGTGQTATAAGSGDMNPEEDMPAETINAPANAPTPAEAADPALSTNPVPAAPNLGAAFAPR